MQSILLNTLYIRSMPSECARASIARARTVTIYTNSFQELDILVLSFVAGALRVQLHMDDVIDFIVDDVMILLY